MADPGTSGVGKGKTVSRITSVVLEYPYEFRLNDSQEIDHAMSVVPAGAGEAVWIGSFGTIYKVTSETTDGAVAVVEHVLGPRQLGAPFHRHSREDEISYVLEGELTVEQGHEIERAGVGGTIVKRRGVFHAFWNAGASPVRFLEVIVPGTFAGYFRELAPLFQRPGPPDLAALSSLAGRYGVEFAFDSLGPLLERHGLRLG